MEKKNQIVMLKGNQLKHHPENPRKSFGDLEELSASIHQNGILQNLTVVPVPDEEDSYYIVIGNRRFEAGQIAGLEEYPCHISNMSYVEQLQTMLIENMQRSDLTLIEQADGFEQLTLNGFSVEDISSSTGFSQSTVRRRLTVAKLDKESVAEAEAKAEEKISKLKQELKTAKEKTKQAEASKASAVKEAKENAIKEANKKIDKLVADGKEKDAKLQDAIKAAKVAGADEDTIAVRILFNDLQSTANELKKHISVIQNKDPEKADKLTATISKTMLSLFGNVD